MTKKSSEKDGKEKTQGIVTSHCMQKKQEYSDNTILCPLQMSVHHTVLFS